MKKKLLELKEKNQFPCMINFKKKRQYDTEIKMVM